jgi:hypothetical protein
MTLLKRHKKDNMNEEVKQEYGSLIAKKSEKLSTALYLVTDLMTENEPIKHSLRKNAVALLSSMNSLAQLDVKDRIFELKMSLKSVTEIISLLHVAVTTGTVSEMNGKLLIDGFRSLQLVLEKKQPIFTKEMLTVDHEEELSEGEGFSSAVTTSSYDVLTPLSLARLHSTTEELRRSQESIRQAQILSKLGVKDYKGQSVEAASEKDNKNIKDNSSTHDVLFRHISKPQNSAQFASSFQMKKQSRRDQILALFVKGVDISIKDIATKIKGCSEKTIQRELNALLFDNSIERIGEKRWSRYVLR